MMFTTSRLDAFASAPDALFIHVTLLSHTESVPSILYTSRQPHTSTPKHFQIFVESERIHIGNFLELNNKELTVIIYVLVEPDVFNLPVHLTS
jgi:hypothetical protein